MSNDIAVNYLKLGDKVYAISEIQAKGVDINAELKEFYDQRHGQLAEEFGQVLNDSMQQEWDTQIAHLRKFETRGQIAVPDSMFGKVVMVHNNKLLPVRPIVYAPDEVSASISWLRSRCSNINFRLGMWRPFTNDSEVVLTIKPLFAIALPICYDKQANQMYTPTLRTFHTMSYGNNVCTGRHKASDFWKLSDEAFNKEMNRINTFSPASSTVRIGGRDYGFADIINNETITNVRERGTTQWRT